MTARDLLLPIVASHPWIDARQAAGLTGLSFRQTNRALAQGVEDRVLQMCHVAGLCTHGALYALKGKRAISSLAEYVSPIRLEKALLRIEALWGARNLLAHLARHETLLQSASPDRLCALHDEGRSCLDVLAWGTLARDQGELPFVVEWDLGEVVPEAYRRRFDALYRFSRLAGAHDFPVWVMVTTNRIRAMQLLWLWHETASRCQVHPLRFYVAEWSAVASGRRDVWRQCGNESIPIGLFHGEPAQAARSVPLQPYRDEGRAARSVGFSSDRVLASDNPRCVLSRAHLSVPDRAARRVLRKVANWPLLSPHELALLMDDWETNLCVALQRLRELGLVGEYRLPQEPARYYATALGVQLLAAASGLEPGQYVRYRRWPSKGSASHPASSDTSGGVGTAWRGRQLNVEALARHWQHTRQVREFFVLLAEVARHNRELRRDHGLIVWDEGECRRYYRAEGRRHALVPDSGGVYRIGSELFEFFLEVDRGTMSRQKLARKFGCYYAYRQTGEYLRGGTHLPRLFVIVPGEGRAHLVRQVILERAKLAGIAPLDAWVAVEDTLQARGPAAPVWRHVVDWKLRCCFDGFEQSEQLPRPLDLAEVSREVSRDFQRARTIRARRAAAR